jgi:CRP/FNR family transcriptional regulator, cyclic AMP receptor protein
MDPMYDRLAGHPFLAGLSTDEIARLAALAVPVRFDPGTRVFDEGGDARGFWLIHDGRVRLDTVGPGRGPVIVETLGPGTVLGWSWLFPPRRWHFGADTTIETTTTYLDGPAVLELCEAMPALGYRLTAGFLRVVVDRLQNTRVRLLDLYGGAG